MRRLMALETPAPILISGSPTTIPDLIGRPPLPLYSAVSSHLRSASSRVPKRTPHRYEVLSRLKRTTLFLRLNDAELVEERTEISIEGDAADKEE